MGRGHNPDMRSVVIFQQTYTGGGGTNCSPWQHHHGIKLTGGGASLCLTLHRPPVLDRPHWGRYPGIEATVLKSIRDVLTWCLCALASRVSFRTGSRPKGQGDSNPPPPPRAPLYLISVETNFPLQDLYSECPIFFFFLFSSFFLSPYRWKD